MEKPHKRLKIWQLAMDIVEDVYKISGEFPSEEKFGLVSQMRKSAVNIPSNIAEGAGRNTKKEFINSLQIAQGSLSKLDTHMENALRLKFIDDKTWKGLDSKLLEQDKMLSVLINALNKGK